MNKKDRKKLSEIHDSYINGQKKQMVTQVKAYGVGRFHEDFYSYVKTLELLQPLIEYAVIVYSYHLINNSAFNR